MTQTVGRILWKELRAQRALFLTLVVGGVLMQLVVVGLHPFWSHPSPSDIIDAALKVAVILTYSFAAGSTAILFAGEKETNTLALLQRVPLRWGDLLIGKLALAIGGSLAVLAALAGSGASMSLLAESSVSSIVQEVALAGQSAGHLAEFLCFLIAVVLFFSLLLRDVLKALLLGVAFAFSLLVLGSLIPSSPRWDLAIECANLAVLVAVIVVDVQLATRWLRESPLGPSWVPTIEFRRGRSAAHAAGSLLDSARSPVAWRRSFSSLAWKEWRQARPLFIPVLVLLLVASFIAFRFDTARPGWLLGWGNILIGWVFGSASFRDDKTSRCYRMLAAHGVSPNSYWWTKQVVGMSLALLVTAAWLAIFAAMAATFYRADILSAKAFLQMAALLGVGAWQALEAYAIAELCALLIPALIPAAAMGLFAVAGLVLFSALVAPYQLPLSLTIAPCPFIFLAASWFRTGDWLAERSTRRAWSKTVAVLAIPAACLFLIAIVYRVVEVPKESSPNLLMVQASVPAPPRSGSRDAESLFVEAAQLTRMPGSTDGTPEEQVPWFVHRHEWPEKGAWGKGVSTGWGKATAQQKKWVDENQAALKLALEAVRRPPAPPADGPAFAKEIGWDRLTSLLLYSARKFESQDKLDDALECYCAAIRLGDELARASILRNWQKSEGTAVTALQWMTLWAAHPKQTPQRIKRAIAEIERVTSVPPISRSVLRSWNRNRLAAADAQSRMRIPLTPPMRRAGRTDPDGSMLAGMFPWERARLLRVLDLLYARAVDDAEWTERNLADVPSSGIDLIRMLNGDIVSALHWPTIPLLRRRDLDFPLAAFDSPCWCSDERLVEYLLSTPAIQEAVEPSTDATLLARAGTVEIDAVALRRMQLIALALYGWRHDHNQHFPNRLEELVPQYLARLSLDPWSGSDFRWYPHGADVMPFLFEDFVIQTDEPFIEALGPFGVRQGWQAKESHAEIRREPAEKRGAFEAWQQGVPVLPLPSNPGQPEAARPKRRPHDGRRLLATRREIRR
jgi:hypothetical protein